VRITKAESEVSRVSRLHVCGTRATIWEIRPIPILLGSMQHQLTTLGAGSDYF
jgi:hypothetical protein